jgi:hypothetical protein
MTKIFDDSTSSNSGSSQIVTPNVLDLLSVGPVYQEFSSGGTAATLNSVSLDLSDTTSDGGTVTVKLYADNAGSAGTAVTTLGTILDSALSSSAAGTFYTLNFSSSYTLTANTTYWIGLSTNLAANGAYWHYTNAPVGTTGELSQSNSGTSSNEMLMTLSNSLCFAAGARVLTACGEVGVETLAEGDLVLGMKSGQYQAIRWVGRRDVDLRTHPFPEAINPVRVCTDAFGPGQPHRDLILSPNHALYVDGHFIAVRYLLNGATIRQEQWDTISYYHVELESHDVMLVDGMTAESFLDVGNRAAFSNGGEPVMLHPDFARQTWDAQSCAPDLARGEELTRLRSMLLDRVTQLGYTLTDDANLRVIAGTSRIRPIACAEGVHFHLPKGTKSVRLESRSFRPSETRADAEDPRVLGLGVTGLMLDGKPIALDDARLTAGWHAPEPGLRWTSGDATLLTRGARTLTLALFHDATYLVASRAAEAARVAA